jgi:hypothetical protein
MSAKTDQHFYIFTPHGVFPQSGESAKIALNRFMRINPVAEIIGIFREDLIVKPPRGTGAPPYLCMFNAGELRPPPNPEEGFPVDKGGSARRGAEEEQGARK